MNRTGRMAEENAYPPSLPLQSFYESIIFRSEPHTRLAEYLIPPISVNYLMTSNCKKDKPVAFS